MNEVKAIYKSNGGDPNIQIQIGNIHLTIPQWKVKNRNNRSQAHVVLTDLGQEVWIKVGQKYHDNKLEVLKSEFEYTKR